MDLSILVPIYNVEKYISQCLDSLVMQELDNYEIVCINDGSTDSSASIVEEYVRKYPNKVKLLNKKNGGLSDARNYGLKYSQGKYIGFVDADDWVDTKMFIHLYNTAVSKDADVVVCNYIEVYDGYTKVIKDNSPKYALLYEAPVWNKIFRRSLFVDYKIEFPKGLWYEDNGTTYKLLSVANNVVYLDRDFYYYRKNRPGSIMSSQVSNKIYDVYAIGDTLHEFFREHIKDDGKYEQLEYIFIKNLFFRQIPKIVRYEAPNIFCVKKKLRQHYDFIESYFPKWYSNKIFVKDEGNYFYDKVGKHHVRRVRGFNKGLTITFLVVLLNRLICKRKNKD